MPPQKPKNALHTVRWLPLLGVGLTLVVIAGLALMLRAVPERVQTGRVAHSSPVETPLPVMENNIIHLPTLGPDREADTFPTVTAFPTFTPWPTPTPDNKPLPTPLSLPEPAIDASGTILYSVRSWSNNSSNEVPADSHIQQLQIDATGKMVSSTLPLEIGEIGWQRIVPSRDQELVALILGTTAGDRISILDPFSGQIVTLSDLMKVYGRFIEWHPNGQQILFLVEGGQPETGLYLIDIRSGDLSLVVFQRPLYIVDAAISPDGRRVVYVSQKGIYAQSELWVSYIDGTQPSLVHLDTSVYGLTWSPDGTGIAFVSGASLSVIDLEGDQGKNYRILSSNFRGIYPFKPVWSPDSRYLAYVAFEPEIAPSELYSKEYSVERWNLEAFWGSNVHLIDVPNGKAQVPVPLVTAKQRVGNIDPVWSPDGKTIAFVGLRGDETGLWTIRLDGTELRQLVKSDKVLRFPFWVRQVSQ